MKRMRWSAPTFALALAASAILFGHVPAASAQQGPSPRNEGNAPGGCYICGTLDYVFVEGAWWFGTVAEDACEKNLGDGRTTPGMRRNYCEKIEAKGRTCPRAAGTCNSRNGKYCGSNVPGKGFVYGDAYGGGVHSDPSSNSPVLVTIPRGQRLLHTGTMRTADGQTWYHVEYPTGGWVPGRDVSCTRPYVPLPSPIPPGTGTYPSMPTAASAPTAGARG